MLTDTRVVGSTKARAAKAAQDASEDGSKPKVAAFGTKMPRGDNYGASARTGGGVVRVPGALVRRDGMIDAARLAQLADMANTTGFLISPVHGAAQNTGYAVGARKDRERLIGGRVTESDVIEYVRDNKDMLSAPGVMLCAARDRRAGVTYLNMVAVVRNLNLARNLARVNACGWFVDVQSGRTTLVTRAVA